MNGMDAACFALFRDSTVKHPLKMSESRTTQAVQPQMWKEGNLLQDFVRVFVDPATGIAASIKEQRFGFAQKHGITALAVQVHKKSIF